MILEKLAQLHFTPQQDFFRQLNAEEKLQALREMMDVSHRIVFFGGAGTSTDCGIPDFRSKNGLYNTKDAQFDAYQPEYLLSHDCLYHNPKVFFSFYRQKLDFRQANPVAFHHTLTEWEQNSKLSAIITQNIDGIHQKAGSRNVLEIHGSAQTCHCTKCNKEYTNEIIFESESTIPRCIECNGMIRPDITLYSESLPKQAYNKAFEAIESADMLIVAGTSLQVEPAASMIWSFTGKFLIYINREIPNNIPNYFDLIFELPINQVFDKITKKENNT